MSDTKKGSGVKINTTKDAGEGDVLGATLAAYEQGWSMNDVSDPVGQHPEYDGSMYKTLKGSGSKP